MLGKIKKIKNDGKTFNHPSKYMKVRKSSSEIMCKHVEMSFFRNQRCKHWHCIQNCLKFVMETLIQTLTTNFVAARKKYTCKNLPIFTIQNSLLQYYYRRLF